MTLLLADIDECIIESSVCDQNAHCFNLNGTYNCSCTMGYSGDGRYCEGEF